MLNWFRNLTKQKQIINTKTECPTVVWIHGANQTSLSFNYLRAKTNFEREYLIDYSSMNRFYYNLDKMIV